MDFLNNGPGGFFSQFGGMAAGPAVHSSHAHPRAYDEYFKAYSVAMLPGKERVNLSYGGKIIMPPSALAKLTQLDLEYPYMFQLRNPDNPAALTHAGVLEFIAQEGVVHLPYWMMKTLRLQEGDTIRITGTELPKGKLVKLQAQHVHFLEISNHKAVLEQALRNFSALTQGDIIEISYNSIVFGLLVMEAKPGGGGIDVLDTDLEVDFAAPVGYVEPERPKPMPIPTMASKLGIDINGASPGSSRPASALSGGFPTTVGTVVSKGGDHWESFKGKGETLAGRKTKGRGISLRPAEVLSNNKIIKTDQHRIVSNSNYDHDVKVPAALNLPFGQLFFGFNVAAYVPPEPQEAPKSPEQGSQAFNGSGRTLSGRNETTTSSSKGKGKEKDEPPVSWSAGGQKLGARTGLSQNGPMGAGGASVPRVPQRPAKIQEKERSPTPDFGVDDDDDAIMIDSDDD